MNIKKLGFSALAGSLVAASATAGEMSVSGGANLYMTAVDENGKTTWSNDDHVTFSGSGDLDNGMTVTFSLQLDGDESDDGAIDNHSVTVNTNGMGTITYGGHGGDTVMSGMDDKTPTAYEEAFDSLGGTTAIVINGESGNDIIRYDSESFGGAQFHFAIMPSTADSATTHSGGVYSDFGLTISPEAVDGLTIGYASGESEVTAGTAVDESTFYVTYAYGPITVGYQESEYDAPSATDTDESESFGISYQVSDELSVSYNEHTVDVGSTTGDQESEGVSISYTMGGVTIAGHANDMQNVGGTTTNDKEGYEINLGFAF